MQNTLTALTKVWTCRQTRDERRRRAEERRKDKAREDFISYWDGYEFLAEPRLIQWEQGYYDKCWDKRCMNINSKY